MIEKKIIYIGIAVLIFLVGAMIVRFGFGGAEDTWICQDNQWVKHGNPSAPMPETGCGQISSITNFNECVVAGNIVLESYPRQCRAQDGQTFTETIGNELEKGNLIRISSPRPNEEVSSPLAISGEARGYWFFEASFPVRLYDAENNLIVTGIATAQDEWMTENFVPFFVNLEFSGVTGQGRLVLGKDNPSGLPENDD